MRALIDLVFPPTCASCGVMGERFLCDPCHAQLPPLGRCCPRCAQPDPGPRCRTCARLRPAFVAAHAATRYEGVARDALLSYKLGGERRLAPALARMFVAACPPFSPDVATFVPSTARTTAERGFDPAAELARYVTREVMCPGQPLLRKVRSTRDQAGLDVDERRRNQDGAYRAVRKVQGTVLLIDDILTTGATADACARVLERAGADRVIVGVIARTP